jgi:Ribonuclease G/E
MIVIDVNTGKFIGKGGNLEETVTKNNLEAAEEIARQLRLRDMGGIIVIDFIDMTLESNRELVLRRLVECLGRDRTKHQVAEVTSLGLVQMTRKRVGQGLIEAFSTTCESCGGRGIHIHSDPVKKVALEKDMEQRFSKTSKSASDDDDDEDDLDDKSETSIDAESISTDEEVEQTPPAPAARRKGRRAVSTGVISTN